MIDNPFSDSEASEEARLEELARMGLADLPSEPEFDEIVRLASGVCAVPMSAMTLLNRNSQYVKSAVGMQTGHMPREQAFCRYTMRSAQMFTIPDTHTDDRFVSNMLVTENPHIRFYSGVPLQAESGAAVGALCVLDTEPRELTAEQEWSLQMLGRLLSARVQLRARTRALEAQHRELTQQRELLRVFLDSLPLEASVKDGEGRILLYNRALADHFGVTTEEWLGKTDHDLLDKDKADQLRMEEDHVLRSGQRHESYMELERPPHGREYWKLIKAPVKLEDGCQLLSTVAVNLTSELQREAQLMTLQDDLEEANRKLQSLSLTDSLTGLWNRRAFDARLETEIFAAERAHTEVTLLLVDIDHFKQLNDTYGHPHGDEVLQQVAGVLRRAVRAEDVAVRYGGEEFAVILPRSSTEGAGTLCKRLATMLEGVHWKHRQVTVSIGVASFQSGLNSDDLLNMADKALYQAKRNGRNCAVVYQAESPPASAE